MTIFTTIKCSDLKAETNKEKLKNFILLVKKKKKKAESRLTSKTEKQSFILLGFSKITLISR